MIDRNTWVGRLLEREYYAQDLVRQRLHERRAAEQALRTYLQAEQGSLTDPRGRELKAVAADARAKWAESTKKLDSVREEITKAREWQAQEDDKALREESAFWFRRFHTSLAISHGAGFVAITSQMFDPDLSKSIVAAAWIPMASFASGMLIAGLIPVALYRHSQGWAWMLAITSCGLLLVSLLASLAATWRLAGLALP